MIRVKCANPKCTAPDGVFYWERKTGYEEAKTGEPGAVSFIVECSFCGTRNKVWLKRSYTRGLPGYPSPPPKRGP